MSPGYDIACRKCCACSVIFAISFTEAAAAGHYDILKLSLLGRDSQLESKPNLIFVATRVPYPPVTGHHLRTLNILRGLAEHFSVHFFGFRDKGGTPTEHRLADQGLLQICSSIHIEVVRAEQSRGRLLTDLAASLLTGRPFTALKYRSQTMDRAIRTMLAAGGIAVAHADSLQSGQYVCAIRGPKLLTNHNVEHLRLLSYSAKQRSTVYRLALRAQAWLTKRYEREILQTIGNCVVVSESDRVELARLVPSARFFVVRNGADTSLPPLPPANPSELTALWVGGMNDPFNREGVLYFASQVLPRVRERLPGFRWRVVGRDPPKALRTLAADPASGVVLAGFVPALRDAYEQAAIAVVPLISGGGTKLKVLEAMAMGRAVATTAVGAEGIEVTDGIDMEIASSDEDFARRITGLLGDPARRNRMAAAARAIAERKYAWEVVNRQMRSAVESAIRSYSGVEPPVVCAE